LSSGSRSNPPKGDPKGAALAGKVPVGDVLDKWIVSTRPTRSDRAGSTEVGDGWSLPRIFGRGTVVIIVIAILAFGIGAGGVLYRQARSDADRAERDLVVRSSRVLQASSEALAAALAGASAVVDPSGKVEQLRFETFAQGAVSTNRVQVLAFVPVIGADERAGFEKTAGLSITEPGANGYISADQRDQYLPVQFVYPATETSRSVIGFDTASDPVRLATSNAARDSGELVFSAPVPSQPSGRTAGRDRGFRVRSHVVDGAAHVGDGATPEWGEGEHHRR